VGEGGLGCRGRKETERGEIAFALSKGAGTGDTKQIDGFSGNLEA